MKKVLGTVIVVVYLLYIASMLTSCARDPQRAKAKYLAAGQKYMKKGQYGDAAIEFRNALRLDPSFVDAYYQLAQAYLAHHDWTAAYGSLQKAIELDPNRLDARLERGRLYLAAREFDKVEEEADSILRRDSKNVGGYQLLGVAMIEEGKPEQSLAALSKVTELLPNDAASYVNVGLVEITMHRWTAAENHLKKAVQVDPKSVQARVNLANFYHLQKQIPEAERVLQTAIQNDPDAAAYYLDWASMLWDQGKTAEAGAILDKLRTQTPKSVESAIAIGDFYSERRDRDKGLAEYRRGLSIAPKNLDIDKRMEDYYLTSNQLEQAAQIDGQLVKVAPRDVTVRINRGRLLMAQAKGQDAQNELLKTVKDAADSWQAHYYLGICYWQNGSLGQANRELQEALRISPDSRVVLQSLAQLSLSQGNAAAARVYAQELVRKNPTDASHRLVLGEILLREGQGRSAEEQFLTAKQLAPNDSMVHVDLGQLYSAEKKSGEAEKEFETAVQLDPTSLRPLNEYVGFLLAHQRIPKAIAHLEQFLNANPDSSQGHLMLGESHFVAKNYSAATVEFKRIIQLDPKNQLAYLQLAKIYQVQDQADLAIEQYKKALDTGPSTAPICTMIGNAYLRKGDFETAKQYFQKAIDADPNFAIAASNLAWVDALAGKDLDVALSMAQKAKSEMPNLPAITDTLAWVMYKRGNFAAAVPLLEECVQKSPDTAEFRFHLGMTLMAMGQITRGKGQLQTALQMKLDAIEVQEAKQMLAQTN